MSVPQQSPAQIPEQIPQQQSTGMAEVDAIVGSLDELDTLPIDEHVAVFERAHERLRQVLDGARE